MAVVGVVSRSKVLLMVDLNRVFSLAYFVGTGKCHERLQQRRHASASSSAAGVRRAALAPPPEARAATAAASCTTSVRTYAATASSSSSSASSASDAPDGATRAALSNDGVPVSVEFRGGVPQLTVPLPSRRERCRFTLRPISNTVGDFLAMLQHEDKGIDRVSVLTEDGVRIASSSTIESLLMDNFRLTINDIEYKVNVPDRATLKIAKDDLNRLSDVRLIVHQLYEALNVEEHQIKKERELLEKLELLKSKIEPLEKKRQSLEAVAARRTNALTWVGLGLMSVQFGILARLTWWEYSWDIMEPVTYFVTYGTAMAAYAYFVLTKQEYLLPDVRDRQHLITLHKRANKVGLDVSQYNTLKDEIARTEHDLARLRDPLHLHVPQRGGGSSSTTFASGLTSSLAGSSSSVSIPLERLRAYVSNALRREKPRP